MQNACDPENLLNPDEDLALLDELSAILRRENTTGIPEDEQTDIIQKLMEDLLHR